MPHPTTLIALTIALLATPAVAQAAPAEAPPPPRSLADPEVAVGITALKEHGFGVAARALVGRVGVEAALATQPWFYAIAGGCNEVHFEFLKHATAGAVIAVANIKDKFRVLVKAGAGWNEAVGPEGRAGAGFDLYLGKRMFLDFGAGIAVVPGVVDRMRAVAKDKCGTGALTSSDESQAIVQPFVGATLYFRF